MTPAAGVLSLVATPIGNLEDVSLRALRVLREAAFIACEDTRTTRKLLSRHAIAGRLLSCHEHNEGRRAGEIVAALRRGERVALVTDAGTPGVSDPGRRVVEAVLAAGLTVEPVPGPSALLAALVASGLPAERFAFLGFVPRKGRERREAIELALGFPGAVVLYEAPHRIVRTLVDLAALAPERPASLHREITKLHEEAWRGTIDELARRAQRGGPRGEITLVLGPPPAAASAPDLEEALAEARRLLAGGKSARDAAQEAARASGAPRRAIYRRLLGGGRPDEEE